MEFLKIEKFLGRLSKEIIVSGSKSVTNRALIMAAFADGVSVIDGVLKSDDCDAALKVLEDLGVKFDINDTRVIIYGGKNTFHKQADLNLRSSGTLARFLPPLLATIDGGLYHLDGSEQLKKRPLSTVVEAVLSIGGDISNDSLPFVINGKNIKGGELSISAEKSSQYASGLMMAAPYFLGETKIKVTGVNVKEECYILMTKEMMADFGAKIEFFEDDATFEIKPTGYKAKNYTIEADFNTASYFLTLAAISKSEITVTNLNKNTLQPGLLFLELLKQIGAEVVATNDFIKVKGTDNLRGGFTVDMRKMAEMALTLAAIAPFLDAPITMNNIAHIRGHECDRIKAMVYNLTELGVKCDEFSDGITIYPSKVKKARIDSFDDHRVAMAFSLSLLKGEGGEIENPKCVKKTCPNYFEILKGLGIGVVYP